MIISIRKKMKMNIFMTVFRCWPLVTLGPEGGVCRYVFRSQASHQSEATE